MVVLLRRSAVTLHEQIDQCLSIINHLRLFLFGMLSSHDHFDFNYRQFYEGHLSNRLQITIYLLKI